QTNRAALAERARPDLVPRLVHDVEGRALRIEHVRRGDCDPTKDLLDVRLERELTLELEQRFELLGLAQRCHPARFLLNWSCAARGHTCVCGRAPLPDSPRRGAAHAELLIGVPYPAPNP